MKGIIPAHLMPRLSDRFEIIGDVAVVSIPQELDDYRDDIARQITSKQRNIRTVLNKVSKLAGDKRIAEFEILSGDSTETVHREYGYIYKLDVKEVFFNGRLSFERRRIASMVSPSEQVLVPFCGVGPFAVPAAASGARVIAIEKNADACRWLAENIRINGVNDNISVIKGDAVNTKKMLNCTFDRVIVPTPYGMDYFLKDISRLVRKGGMVHFYTFKKQYQIEGLVKEYKDIGFEVIFYRRCGNVAPGVSRWVFDLVKQ
jgi:tRNA (guanine37-N1)-methyltransferase